MMALYTSFQFWFFLKGFVSSIIAFFQLGWESFINSGRNKNGRNRGQESLMHMKWNYWLESQFMLASTCVSSGEDYHREQHEMRTCLKRHLEFWIMDWWWYKKRWSILHIIQSIYVKNLSMFWRQLFNWRNHGIIDIVLILRYGHWAVKNIGSREQTYHLWIPVWRILVYLGGNSLNWRSHWMSINILMHGQWRINKSLLINAVRLPQRLIWAWKIFSLKRKKN